MTIRPSLHGFLLICHISMYSYRLSVSSQLNKLMDITYPTSTFYRFNGWSKLQVIMETWLLKGISRAFVHGCPAKGEGIARWCQNVYSIHTNNRVGLSLFVRGVRLRYNLGNEPDWTSHCEDLFLWTLMLQCLFRKSVYELYEVSVSGLLWQDCCVCLLQFGLSKSMSNFCTGEWSKRLL